MRVAFVVASLGAGGAERVIALIASTWARVGRDVTVFAFDAADAPVYHAFDPRVRIVKLGSGRAARGVTGWLGRMYQLRAALQGDAPDVLVGFLTKINVIALLASVGLGIPVVASERNNPRRQAASRMWTVALGLLYRRAAAIVLQTEASRQCLPLAVRTRALVIPNPVDIPPPASGGTHTQRIVTAVGRLDPQKGFDRLIDAFAESLPQHPDWRLRIWGTGPLRDELVAQASRLGVAGSVEFAGVSAVPLGWTAGADIFVLSSRFEGFPNVLAEAMAAGLPVVAFDCDYGPREMIVHGSTGLLVPEGDVAGLARSIGQVMRSDALRDALGAAARRSAERYRVEQVVAKWDAALAGLPLHGRKPRLGGDRAVSRAAVTGSSSR